MDGIVFTNKLQFANHSPRHDTSIPRCDLVYFDILLVPFHRFNGIVPGNGTQRELEPMMGVFLAVCYTRTTALIGAHYVDCAYEAVAF